MICHIIFDCDGVLVDSEPLSMRADVELLAQHGIHMSEDEAHHRFVGKTFKAMAEELEAEFNLRLPPDLSAQKDRRVEELFHAHLQPVPGIAATLETLKDKGVSFSIASNSPSPRVHLAVKLAGIADHFTHIVTRDDVPNGKPAPDVFLRAAEMSGWPVTACLAVEDSITGVTAALAAGLATIGYVGVYPDPDPQARKLHGLGAAHVIADMGELPGLVAAG